MRAAIDKLNNALVENTKPRTNNANMEDEEQQPIIVSIPCQKPTQNQRSSGTMANAKFAFQFDDTPNGTVRLQFDLDNRKTLPFGSRQQRQHGWVRLQEGSKLIDLQSMQVLKINIDNDPSPASRAWVDVRDATHAKELSRNQNNLTILKKGRQHIKSDAECVMLLK
jgi:hypothetical protein